MAPVSKTGGSNPLQVQVLYPPPKQFTLKNIFDNFSPGLYLKFMTGDKIIEVLNIYRKTFEERGIPKKECRHDLFPDLDNDFLAHCHGMTDQMEVFIKQGRMDKVFRWLGFMQGVMWALRVYTVCEMADHNRPR